eukprot:TRINITY_DN11117_c0_g1_i3.p1 TRINITY_DN11117_c0_g1~~TRINITY_DN11117_c0_g1_i3.p1  ORF type:complete len:319 (-),score=70.38 TRINITY_DN11117_c0_g1_i3:399-1325(-)
MASDKENWIEPNDYFNGGRIRLRPNEFGKPESKSSGPLSCCRNAHPDIPIMPALLCPDDAKQLSSNDSSDRWFTKPSEEMRRAVVIVNPHGGGGNALAVFEHTAVPVLKQMKIEYTIKLTEKRNDAHQFAVELASKDQCDILIVVGGDGTIFEVVNGVMQKQPEMRPTLVFLPGGTGSNVCRSLGISPATFESSLKSGIIAHLDVGRIKSGQNLEVVKYFMNVLCWGLAADGAAYAENSLMRYAGILRYDLASLLAILEGKKRTSEITIDGQKLDSTTTKVFFSHGESALWKRLESWTLLCHERWHVR